MRVRLRAFAALRDRLGWSEREIELGPGADVRTAAEAALGSPLPRGLAFAVNESFAGLDTTLAEGDEIALLPPVSGGAPLLRVQSEPIDPAALLAAVREPACGAVLSFFGTAREVPGDQLVHLEYEAFTALAERFFTDLAEEIRLRTGVERLAIVHRTGRIPVGEISIGIAVASPHREAGFAALRHAIERIKEQAPVWKKEVTRRGERWVAIEKLEGG